MKKWEQLEQWVCEHLKEIESTICRTPGSGNGNKKGDVTCKTNIGLHVECKCYQKKNVWDVEWIKKANEEIPLHSNKIAIVVTENEKEERHVHLNADDFFNLYIEFFKLKNGE